LVSFALAGHMANELRRGAQFPTLIFVAKDVDAYLVVMEGNVRLTAYLMAPECRD